MSVIESTIEGRYQVITRIAAGGMGEVYRAHDAVLGREVAVKVLHAHLAGDRGFVDRFRREARAAAILNHPSIVGVYDWGVTDGTYFMVMEYVRGVNLRALLAAYNRLDPAQVVEVTLPVLAALDHAHGHGIVHRDVKPENILISEDGMVKVADFGLARAYAESYVSQAEGTVTGTVQYLAPEQVQGDPADPRTDLYSLGVVMFECLTGRPPFAGETSLSIAYQHLSSEVPAPSTVEPGLPPALDRAVLHATAKDRGERPGSAREFRDEVVRAGIGLPPAPPLTALAGQIPSADLVSEDRAPTVTIPRTLSARRRRALAMRRALGVLAVLVALAAGGWATWTYLIPHYAKLPALAGVPVDQAMTRVRSLGLTPILRQEFSLTVKSGQVIRTIPSRGTKVRKGRQVVVVGSVGPEMVTVPEVVGQTFNAAKAALERDGFTVGRHADYDDTVLLGQVISQSPEGSQRAVKGSRVTLHVSKGPPPVRLPDVTGIAEPDARSTLEGLGFVVKETKDFSASVPNGSVISQDPAGDTTQPKGSTVDLVISKGPESFPMPSVVGMSSEQARSELEGLGLTVEITLIPGTTGDQVVYQDVAAGTTVHQGDTVKLYVTGP